MSKPINNLGCIIALVILSTGCVNSAPYAEIGIGHNASFTNDTHEWENGNSLGAVFEVGYEGEVRNNPNLTAGCRYMHVSQWFAGPPFNNNAESSLDHLGCKTRYTFRR